MRNTFLQNKNIPRIAFAVGYILLALLAVMQFTGALDWSLGDFLLAGGLLFVVALVYELLVRSAGSPFYKAGMALALATALFLVVSSLALGIIGSEDNPANLMYIAVIAVLVTGAVFAGFRARGMAKALFATALAQALVGAVAIVAVQDVDRLDIVMLTAFFAALWAGAGFLFRRAE